jgi:hypothetical protein
MWVEARIRKQQFQPAMNLPEDISVELEQAVRELRTVAHWFSSPAFVAIVRDTHLQAAREELSPWLSHKAAQARWFKSRSSIEAAVAAGVLTAHKAGGAVMFLKEQGDEAIRSGKWPVERAEKPEESA